MTINGQTSDDVLAIADSMPTFPGGLIGVARHIQQYLNVPAEVREAGADVKAYIKFVVDTNGKVINPVVAKTSGVKEFDRAASKVISIMPRWHPGLDKNKKVMVGMTIPVSWKVGGNLEPPRETEEQKKAMSYYYDGRKLEYEAKYAMALDKLTLALNFEPLNKYALFDKGKVLMVLGEKEKACETWNKMMLNDIRKEEAKEFTNKYCIGDQGPQEMAKYYERIRAIDFFEEGLKIADSGRYEAALRRFDSCLKHNPEHQDALFNKGLMHIKLEQKIAACTSWKKLLAISPQDKQTEELVKKNCN